MSVGAVNSLTYSTSYADLQQYKFFKFVNSPEQIDELMRKYGIIQTGDTYNDLKALYDAMYKEASVDANEEAAGSVAYLKPQDQIKKPENQDPTNVPWATLMNQIGLTATGNLQKDYGSFSEKISIMQVSATTPQDKANLQQLESQASIVFVPQSQTTQTASQNQGPIEKTSASGADIVAMLNKMYFLG